MDEAWAVDTRDIKEKEAAREKGLREGRLSQVSGEIPRPEERRGFRIALTDARGEKRASRAITSD